MTRTLYALSISALLLLAVSSCQKDQIIQNDFVENKVPTVDAGLSKTITLPDSAVLSGTGADADGKVVAYLWSQVSGPYTSSIVNPGATSTVVRFTVAGTYLFQLMATDDKGATGVDTVSVIVSPIPGSKTLTLQPANNPTEFHLVKQGSSDLSGVAGADFLVEAWTSGGNALNYRALLKFDLSSIPTNATIVSANLYLYSYPSPTNNGNFTDANYGTDNSFLVQQVTSSWLPSTATWANQPSASTSNQLVVPTTSQSNLDLNLDVKALVTPMVNNNANYGFMMRLQNEVVYNSRIFISSHNTTYTTKIPKLVVVYK